MGVKHDLAFLDVTILLEEAGHLCLGQAWVNTRHEKVGAWVDSTVILRRTTITLGWAAL
jgi:hypothetical protein